MAKTARNMRKKPVYGTWNQMIQRCTNPRVAAYPDYGGRRCMNAGEAIAEILVRVDGGVVELLLCHGGQRVGQRVKGADKVCVDGGAVAVAPAESNRPRCATGDGDGFDGAALHWGSPCECDLLRFDRRILTDYFR